MTTNDRPLRVYIAARSQERARILADLLREKGFEIVSTWLAEDPAEYQGGYARLTPERADEIADRDLCDIIRADALVVIGQDDVSPTGGKHFETGFAYSAGILVFVYGQPQNLFHRLKTINVCPTFPDLVNALTSLDRELKGEDDAASDARAEARAS